MSARAPVPPASDDRVFDRVDAFQHKGRTLALDCGLPTGTLHSFHQECTHFGVASSDMRRFTKDERFEGRLSILSESTVQMGGVHRYLVQFTAGEVGPADGVGFVFAHVLPCVKNIQKITSIFLNQRGRVCTRVFKEVIKESTNVQPIKIGDWVEMTIDLDTFVVTFNVWPCSALALKKSRPDSTVVFNYGARLAELTKNPAKPKLRAGYLGCVVKDVGTTVTIAS
jgi:hypothetical protein